MLIDVTGTILIPGNQGQDCPGNGVNPEIPCCCDECDYMLCCFGTHDPGMCDDCNDSDCPRVGTKQ